MLIILGPRLTVQYAYNLSILTNLKKGKALFDLKAVFNYLFIYTYTFTVSHKVVRRLITLK